MHLASRDVTDTSLAVDPASVAYLADFGMTVQRELVYLDTALSPDSVGTIADLDDAIRSGYLDTS